mgnify:CR=1 FL=1|jgi:UDP-N-acetylglucosamine transferase subunit ALG13|tara:strand:- start:7276 stop:7770 length:495 start_codon:yes stop_codon:yes gene_type:complete
MIFLTVGTQLPFDRLVTIVNEFSIANPEVKIVGQVGLTQVDGLNFEYYESLSISEFEKFFNESEAVISHAGMGTILTALTSGKGLFMMPRLHKYQEHRNDHQLGTLEKFKNKAFCYGFSSLSELDKCYKEFSLHKKDLNEKFLSPYAPVTMTNTLSDIIRKMMD